MRKADPPLREGDNNGGLEIAIKEGQSAIAAGVFAEAKAEVEGVGGGHGAGVGVENGAGEVAGSSAGEGFGDQGSREAAALEGGTDVEALDLAFGGRVRQGTVGDAGGGLAVEEGEEDFAVAVGVCGGHAGDFGVEDGVVGAAGLRGAEPPAVLAEENLGGEDGGIFGDGGNHRHGTMICGLPMRTPSPRLFPCNSPTDNDLTVF